MKNIPKSGRTTSDRVNVGVKVKTARSMGAAKSGGGDSRVTHPGQPGRFGSIKAKTSVSGASSGRAVTHNGQPTPFGKIGY